MKQHFFSTTVISLFFSVVPATGWAQASMLTEAPIRSEIWGDLSHLSSDNGDGTFSNPVLRADYPNPDIISVGNDYYMISSNAQFAPSIPICHSVDLVNWEVIGHVDDVLSRRPAFAMSDEKVAYGLGNQSPSIRYHEGVFFVATNIEDEGLVLFTSTDPIGPYTRLSFDCQMADPGLFIDDDGSVYCVSGRGAVSLVRLGQVSEVTSGKKLELSAPRVLVTPESGKVFGNSHLYKRDGWYYLWNTDLGAENAQYVSRSRNIDGPYETRLLIRNDFNYAGSNVCRGGFVSTPKGESWTFLSQYRDYAGSQLCLLPLKWEMGWPSVMSQGATTFAKPKMARKQRASAFRYPQQSDDFGQAQLKPCWEFNHAVESNMWSLGHQEGCLRLYSLPCLWKSLPGQDDPSRQERRSLGMFGARNTLTQRVNSPISIAVAKIDISGLLEGDMAGVGIVGQQMFSLGLLRTKTGYEMQLHNSSAEGDELIFVDDEAEGELHVKRYVWMRTQVDENGLILFSYSVDGDIYRLIGGREQSGAFAGSGMRHALFCYNTLDPAGPTDSRTGYADFDFFELTSPCRGNVHSGHLGVRFMDCDERHGFELERENPDLPMQYLTNLTDGSWAKFNNVTNQRPINSIDVQFYAAETGGEVEVRLDGPKGKLLGRAKIQQSCVWVGEGARSREMCFSKPGDWQDETIQIPELSPGSHTLFFKFVGNNPSARINSFRFY